MKYKSDPIFVIGSGRCGTRSLFKIFNKIENVKAYHEYLCELVQKQACKKMMGITNKAQNIKFLKEYYESAISYENKPFWIDCSNKLSWFIPELKEIFPNSKFILLLRDGRKVTSSFFNKLKPEIYENKSVKVMEMWMKSKEKKEPPTEKAYWWILPRYYKLAKDLSKYDQYQKICWHWKTSNTYALDELAKLDSNDYRIIKLEKLINSRSNQIKLFQFIGLEYQSIYFKMLSRPENVFVPYDFKLNNKQIKQFSTICDKLMKYLNYSGKEYDVKY